MLICIKLLQAFSFQKLEIFGLYESKEDFDKKIDPKTLVYAIPEQGITISYHLFDTEKFLSESAKLAAAQAANQQPLVDGSIPSPALEQNQSPVPTHDAPISVDAESKDTTAADVAPTVVH